MPNKLVTEVYRLRKELGLSQQGLAVKLGVSLSSVSRWERGRHKVPRALLIVLRQWANEITKENAS